MNISVFQRHILEWYEKHKRDLPWRKTQNSYYILVSEIMLQQTQVSRVIPKYREFLTHFPTIRRLAQARDRDLLSVWSGLGYWRRAHYLKSSANVIIEKYGGRVPRTQKELQTLPGIGPYTAGAVACFAFRSIEPFIDTNIRRVFLHFFFPRQQGVSDIEILAIARKSVWKEDPKTWHWALFDYGSLELRKGMINQRSKHYTKQSTFKGSFRFFRAQVVRHLLKSSHGIHRNEILDMLEETLRKHERDYSPKEILDALLRDGLIKKKGVRYSL